MQGFSAFLVRLVPFGAVAAVLYWVSRQTFPPAGNAVCIAGSVLAIFPAVFVARNLLDRHPDAGHAASVTACLHAWVIACFGTALIKALQTYVAWRFFVIPLPQEIGFLLVAVTGTATALPVANLALRGLGAPFALALSRRLATDWLYRWTRNPMVLATILWFLAIGLWLQSAGFVAWVLLLATPAELTFLKVYEERELEIRFGDSYRAYKARTPFLWPRRPQPEA